MSKLKIHYGRPYRGNLPFLLCWQSLDGRIEMQYLENLKIAVDRHSYLSRLGRKAKLYREVDSIVQVTTDADRRREGSK